MSDRSYVFIIAANPPVLLHPFDAKEIFEEDSGLTLVGRYGSGDSPKDADAIRTSLYAAMEKGTRRHFLDKGYYVRLAATTITFVVVYLFLSIIVRDPVPLIDELLLGSLAAAAVFLVSERKALASPRHLDAIVRFRKAIDSAYFTESRVVDLVEAWRDEAAALGPAAFYKMDAVTPELGQEERHEAAALCARLAARWKSKPIVAELYDAATVGSVPGSLLDKAVRRLGSEECALALSYLRLIPLTAESREP